MNKLNNKWIANDKCFVCDRWMHTLFVMQPGEYPVPMARTTGLPENSAFHTSKHKSIVMSGSFESLKMLTLDPTMQMMDIK
jgi:hypothetical protein